MTEIILAVKDLDNEYPIPTAWRHTLKLIVSALVTNDFELSNPIDNTKRPAKDVSNHNRTYVEDYGEKLIPLLEKTWVSSRSQWMGTHWDFLLDLCTEFEGVSDLVLHGKAFQNDTNMQVEVGLIYVP